MYCIGLDIHKKNTQACVKDENGKVIVNERFLSEVVAMNAFLDRLGSIEAKVVMEATGFYQYIYETIEARGYDVVLAHPLKLKALTAGRAKTDRNDAEMLAELEDEGLLVKGFLMQDDQTMHWALASEIEKIGPLSKEEFVLTPMDNLWYYIQPQVKERFGTWCYVLFRGPEMVGIFRARKKGSDLIMFEMQGEQDLKESVRKHLREIGLVLREAEANETPEWEVEEFYELTHPGED